MGISLSATPHFCGEPECQAEGMYEIALDAGEPIWAQHEEKERLIEQIEGWQQR